MDIEKLIERLNELYRSLRLDGEQQCSPEINTVAFGLMDAATALSTLKAENAKLRAELEQKTKAAQKYQEEWYKAVATCMKLRAELEQVKAERDAAISDLETIMAYGGGNLDTCQYCKNGQCYARGGTKLCLPKWRGIKED